MTTKKRKSATSEITKWLKKGRSINQLQCLEHFGTWRLSGIIYQIKKSGIDIVSKPKRVKTRYGATTSVVSYKIGK